MTLVPLPAFADNYIWMLQDGRNAIVVDPGDAAPVFEALARGNLQLAAILVTRPGADRAGAHARVSFRRRYTLANRQSARAAEPGNADPTHSTAQFNSTARRALHAHADFCTQAAEADMLAARRQWKNTFR
jgi:glyoxylase-like metal-dependent hydrolase (beta-lactamase superfamily II)